MITKAEVLGPTPGQKDAVTRAGDTIVASLEARPDVGCGAEALAQNHEGPPACDRWRVGRRACRGKSCGTLSREASVRSRHASGPTAATQRRVADAFLALLLLLAELFLLDVDFFFVLQPATLTFDRTVLTAPFCPVSCMSTERSR